MGVEDSEELALAGLKEVSGATYSLTKLSISSSLTPSGAKIPNRAPTGYVPSD